MIRELTYKITEQDNDRTILTYLRNKGYSKPVLTQLKKTPQGIQKNGVWAYVKEQLNTGDSLQIHLEEEEASKNILPVEIPLSICYEDEDLLILNKPANMPVHPSLNHYEYTLANGVAGYYASQNISYVFRCMNRLDKNTTGLVVLAKNMLSAAVLSKQVKERSLHRQYLAIADGITPEQGIIDAPIGRSGDSTIERRIDYENGEWAVTHYKRIAVTRINGQSLSLVSLQLETGRTHQIRVHMQSIGHPLLGDFLYHPDFALIGRQALHSAKVEFVHPVTGKKMEFTCELPEDMKQLFPNYLK